MNEKYAARLCAKLRRCEQQLYDLQVYEVPQNFPQTRELLERSQELLRKAYIKIDNQDDTIT